MKKVTFLSKLTANWSTFAMIGAIAFAGIKLNSTVETKIRKTIQEEMKVQDVKDSVRIVRLESKFRYVVFQLDTAQRNNFDRFVLNNTQDIEAQNRILREMNERQKKQIYMYLFDQIERQPDTLLKKNLCQQGSNPISTL